LNGRDALEALLATAMKQRDYRRPGEAWRMAQVLCEIIYATLHPPGSATFANPGESLDELVRRTAKRGPYPDMLVPTHWTIEPALLNELQQAGIVEVVRMAKLAHWVDVTMRVDGRYVVYQADWIKHLQGGP